MRKLSLFLAVLVSMSAWLGVTSAADSTPYIGAWVGTWEGGGAGGKFDLTLERGGDGKLGGGVVVGEDSGGYTAKFTTAALDGNKLAAKYDYPKADQAEITLTATFDDMKIGSKATGTWALGQKGQDAAFANGTFTVTLP